MVHHQPDEKETRLFSSAGIESMQTNSTVQSKLRQLRKQKAKDKQLRSQDEKKIVPRPRRNAEVWEEALYYPAGIVKNDQVEKLRSDGQWVPRAMALTPELVAFMHTSEGHIVDSVPLEDIVKIAPHWRPRSKDLVRKKIKKATNLLEVDTAHTGYNAGRTYVVKFDTARRCNEWMSKLRYYSRKRISRVQNKSGTEKRQEWARLFQVRFVMFFFCNSGH